MNEKIKWVVPADDEDGHSIMQCDDEYVERDFGPFVKFGILFVYVAATILGVGAFCKWLLED